MPSIQRIRAKYPDRWVAVEITRVEDGEAVEGNLILENEDRRQLWEEVELPKVNEGREVFIFFTGAPLKEGYVAAF